VRTERQLSGTARRDVTGKPTDARVPSRARWSARGVRVRGRRRAGV